MQMKFTKVDIELPKVKQINLPEGRKYVNEEGDSYPSVTTVLSKTADKKFLEEWRKAVGDKEADRVSHHAASQGTAVHDAIEAHILNEEYNKKLMPMQSFLVKGLKKVVNDRLTTVYVTEAMMLSKFLRTAGTVDCIAVFDGVLSIIDWKTSKGIKERDDIHDYFIQTAFYAVAFEELTGIPVPNLVIVMTCETGDILVFKEKRDDWIKEFIKRRYEFEKLSLN